jgi:ketosteroid isomerase-like protein
MTMTTEQTKASMERLYAALGGGDRAALLELFTDDVVWQQPVSVPDWHCVGRENVVDQLGRDVVKRLFKPGTFRLTVRRVARRCSR